MRLLLRREAVFRARWTQFDHEDGMQQLSQPLMRTLPRPDGDGPFTAEGLPCTLWWDDEAAVLRLIDQTLLPAHCDVLTCADAATVAEAIRTLQVRGAPAIGVAAAYGLALGARAALPPSAGPGPEGSLAGLRPTPPGLPAPRPPTA